MQALYDVPAPAKLNLFLHITGQREDGYHLMQSVFMLVDWCDMLHFEKRPKNSAVVRTDLNTPLPADDLIVRAAKALQAATGCQQGVHISVHKNIPAQAGLGGGSSDAASTLLALNRLWQLNLPLSTLQKIGIGLGADVPFFLCGTNAWAEGIGDILTPLERVHKLPQARFTIVKPAAGLETKLIFSSPNLKRDSECATIEGFAERHFDFGRNDLQPVAESICSEVKKAVSFLKLQGLHARMTGSGSAVFAKTSQETNLIQTPSGWVIKTCENLMEHPLAGWASRKN